MVAWKERNHIFVNATVSDSYTFVSPSYKGNFFNKEEWKKMIMITHKLEEFELRILRILDHGEFAIVVSLFIFLSSPSHSGLAQEYLILDTWTQEDSEWKLVCRQPTFIRQAE